MTDENIQVFDCVLFVGCFEVMVRYQGALTVKMKCKITQETKNATGLWKGTATKHPQSSRLFLLCYFTDIAMLMLHTYIDLLLLL